MATKGNHYKENNNNWKGGRHIASNGYVIIRMEPGHHLVDARGYAYEHRVKAEEKLGRRLRQGEIVHHINGDKTDNRLENLHVVSSIAYHWVNHRTETGKKLRLPGENNPVIACACGCGGCFRKYDNNGRPRKFITGHNMFLKRRTA